MNDKFIKTIELLQGKESKHTKPKIHKQKPVNSGKRRRTEHQDDPPKPGLSS